jgi:D-alanyl-D-alanine carboxypeptidase
MPETEACAILDPISPPSPAGGPIAEKGSYPGPPRRPAQDPRLEAPKRPARGWSARATPVGWCRGSCGRHCGFCSYFQTMGPTRYHRQASQDAHHSSHAEGYWPPSCSIVVDGNTGKVLLESNPDAPRHPASLTKIMTLYLLLAMLIHASWMISVAHRGLSQHSQ